MQHILYTSLDEIERGRAEMEAFRQERSGITITGEDIHNAYRAIWPERARPWDELKDFEQWRYNDMAVALTSILLSKEVTITAIRCPQCDEMISDLKGHPCSVTRAETSN